MTMYPRALVESMIELGEVKATLKTLHDKIYDDLSSEEDSTAIDQLVTKLGNVQAQLMTVGVEMAEPEIPTFRKVTINETRSPA